MDKSGIIVAIIVAVVGVGIGIIIGYFAIENSSNDALKEVCEVRDFPSSHVGRCVDTCRSDACQAESCELIQPRSYVSYHLQGKTINIDGKIDEEAWEEVSWTEDFVDLAGVDYPTPHFNTKAKLRWDDTFLYVAARLQEDNVWANKTEHDSKVWQDNAFEIYVDTDGTTHNYKEFQINALKTTWDLRLTKAYLDGGSAQSNWESDAQYGVFTDGVVNDPSTPSTFWSAEIALPFQNLRMNSLQPKAGPPGDNAIWRMVLARPEWGFEITSDGRYIKDETVSASWWSWQPHGVINLHLPNKWGVVQFSRAAVDSQVFTPNEQWKMSEALFAAFNTMQKYKAEFGIYTTDTKLLDLPQLLRTDLCFMKPTIELVNSTFVVSISNKDNTLTGHIRADRYVWFGDKDTGLRVP